MAEKDEKLRKHSAHNAWTVGGILTGVFGFFLTLSYFALAGNSGQLETWSTIAYLAVMLLSLVAIWTAIYKTSWLKQKVELAVFAIIALPILMMIVQHDLSHVDVSGKFVIISQEHGLIQADETCPRGWMIDPRTEKVIYFPDTLFYQGTVEFTDSESKYVRYPFSVNLILHGSGSELFSKHYSPEQLKKKINFHFYELQEWIKKKIDAGEYNGSTIQFVHQSIASDLPKIAFAEWDTNSLRVEKLE